MWLLYFSRRYILHYFSQIALQLYIEKWHLSMHSHAFPWIYWYSIGHMDFVCNDPTSEFLLPYKTLHSFFSLTCYVVSGDRRVQSPFSYNCGHQLLLKLIGDLENSSDTVVSPQAVQWYSNFSLYPGQQSCLTSPSAPSLRQNHLSSEVMELKKLDNS